MEWSEECAFQTVDRRFVNRGGRRFSRDLLDLLYTYYDIMGERGLGKLFRLRSTGALLSTSAHF